MSASYVVVLPAIHRETTERCLRSMRFARDSLLLVDNSDEGWGVAVAEAAGKGLTVMRRETEPFNHGVAASWNLGVRAVVEHKRDFLVICSAAVEFGPRGGLDLIEQLPLDGQAGMEVIGAGWHLIALSRSTLQSVGLFDENLFPAYYEDTDYLYRMGLAGLPSPRENGRRMPDATVDYTDHGTAHAMKLAGVRVDMAKQRRYYCAKWLGDQGQERSVHPFGFENRDWTWWPPVGAVVTP